jgi:hypothetical protein
MPWSRRRGGEQEDEGEEDKAGTCDCLTIRWRRRREGEREDEGEDEEKKKMLNRISTTESRLVYG